MAVLEVGVGVGVGVAVGLGVGEVVGVGVTVGVGVGLTGVGVGVGVATGALSNRSSSTHHRSGWNPGSEQVINWNRSWSSPLEGDVLRLAL